VIPSFSPIHEYFRAALQADSAENLRDTETGLAQKTIEEILSTETPNWRFVDNPHIDYLGLVGCEATQTDLTANSPLTADNKPIVWTGAGADANGTPIPPAIKRAPTVAVVGAGMSGLLTALELRKTGMNVTLYEAYGDPNFAKSPAVAGSVTGQGHAGRVYPLAIDGTDATESQLGCMRFPSRAPLFWWYLRACEALAPNTLLTEFPNPAKVPTIFTGHSTVVSTTGTCSPIWTQAAIWKGGKNRFSLSPYNLPKKVPNKPDYDYQDLSKRHMDAFLNFVPTSGGDTALTVSGLLDAGTATDVSRIKAFWDATIAKLSNASYKNFLSDPNHVYHPGINFTLEEIDRIGTVGFGTGGFEPLFDVCVLDMMRLVLWSYASEIVLPDLKLFPIGLLAAFEAAYIAPAAPQVGTQNAQYNTPVTAVAYQPATAAVPGYYVVSYSAFAANGKSTPGSAKYDYVVLAMTHTAARKLLADSASAPHRPAKSVVPYAGTSKSSFILAGLKNQNIMKTTKIFHLIQGPASKTGTGAGTGIKAGTSWTKARPASAADAVSNAYALPFDHEIRALYGAYNPGKGTLGATYLQPLLVRNPVDKTIANATLSSATQVNALHYSWGYGTEPATDADDVKTLLYNNNADAKKALTSTGFFKGLGGSKLYSAISATMAARFATFNWSPQLSGLATDLPQYFTSSKTAAQNADCIAVYWQNVPYVLGAFKLDAPGYGAHLAYAYKVLAESVPAPSGATWWDAQLRDGNGDLYYSVDPAARGLFFAGDSFSTYGGWVEGAFQSALATSAGLVKQACATWWGRGSSAVVTNAKATKSGTKAVPVIGPNVQVFYNRVAIDALVTNARDPYRFPAPTSTTTH
jgi:hypothetical protein